MMVVNNKQGGGDSINIIALKDKWAQYMDAKGASEAFATIFRHR